MQVLEDGKNLRIMDSDKNDGAQMSWCANRFGFCSIVPTCSKLAIDVILVLVFVGVCWCRIFVVFFPLPVQLHTGKVQDHFAMELEHLFGFTSP